MTKTSKIDLSKSQIIRGLTFDEYRAIDAINYSSISKFTKCQHSYEREHFLGEEIEPTDPMRLGSAIDDLTFFGDTAQKFLDLMHKKTGAPTAKSNKALDCLAEIQRSPLFPKKFQVDEKQVCIIWHSVGLRFKCLVDHLDEKNQKISDLKSTGNLEKFKVFDHFEPASKARQLAFYQWGYEEITTERFGGRFYIVSTGIKPVHLFYQVSPKSLFDLRKGLFRDIGLFQEAIKTKQFKHYERTEDVVNDRCVECDHSQTCPHAVQKEWFNY